MKAESLTDWLWRLHTPGHSGTPSVAAYAVAEGDGFNLIDTGFPGEGEAILEALAGLSDRSDPPNVHEIVLTHGHRDHTGSAAVLAKLTGAKVLGPVGDARFIEEGHAPDPPELADWEVPLLEALGPQALRAAPPVQLDRRLNGSEVLTWEHHARIVPTPGHTRGHVSVLFEEPRVLVAGDAIASTGGEPIVGVFNVDRAEAMRTFRKLADLDLEVACFGHGDPLLSDAAARLSRSASLQATE